MKRERSRGGMRSATLPTSRDEGSTSTSSHPSPSAPLSSDNDVPPASSATPREHPLPASSPPISPSLSGSSSQYPPSSSSSSPTVAGNCSRPAGAPLNQSAFASTEDGGRLSSDSRESERKPVEFAFTKRFEQAAGEGGDGTWVLTGVEGKLERCEDEPIHAPGAIQAFGVLICFDEQENGDLRVQQVSENSRFNLGLPPQTLFACSSFHSLLAPPQSEMLSDALEALEDRYSDPTNTDFSPLNFLLSGEGVPGTSDKGAHSEARQEWTCHAAIHRPDPINRPKRTVLELELVDDPFNPLSTKPMDDPPADIGKSPVTTPVGENIPGKSLIKGEKGKLRTLRRFRMRKQGGGREAIDVTGLLGEIGSQLDKENDFKPFLDSSTELFKELTEFDRVMIYQFDREWNGLVVSEQVNTAATSDVYLGLKFPASDIPPQARELYRLNKVRLLYDRDQPTARICCRDLEEVGRVLDMTHCHLRAMSPIHIKYLGNMGVRSTMSISLIAFGQLWGLVALHHYGKFGQRVSFPVRQFCKLLCDNMSRNIERLTLAKRIEGTRLVSPMTNSLDPSSYILAKAEDLLSLFGADSGILAVANQSKIIGDVGDQLELRKLLSFVRERQFQTVTATRDLANDYPEVQEAGALKTIAGFIVIPLASAGTDFVIFCRGGELEEIKWAGQYFAPGKNPTPLEPRTSFAEWAEISAGKSRPWSEEDREKAAVLCLVYGQFINVWREREDAMHANRLTKLLVANVGHEMRTPLNAIINFLELALEHPMEKEVRENLVRSWESSRTLVHVINDLLDLSREDSGKSRVSPDPFHLQTTLEAALAYHRDTAIGRGISLELTDPPSGTPAVVVGDRVKAKHIVGSLVSNALKHTTRGGVWIEWEAVAKSGSGAVTEPNSIRIRITVNDTGQGISEAQIAALHDQFHQEVPSTPVNPSPARSGELGLVLIGRLIHALDGQLSIESKIGVGSKFIVTLPFLLPASSDIVLIPAAPDRYSGRSQGSSSLSRSTGEGQSEEYFPTTTDPDQLVGELLSDDSLDLNSLHFKPPSRVPPRPFTLRPPF